MAELKKQLDKKTLVKAWALTYSSEACYNYERLQALGNANQMITVVRKLYDTEEEQVEALKKYMVFFNTEPSWMGTVIHGITISMEEQIANGAEITGEDINALRTGLMGPMAGIGDTISQAVCYPILAGICCSFALDGNYAGPIMFEIVYKVRITEAFSIVGLIVVGNMAYSRVTVSCPLKFMSGNVEVVVQDMFDTLLPGVIPLVITMGVWWMIGKKKMNPTVVIGIIFVFGIVCSLLGILGQTAA